MYCIKVINFILKPGDKAEVYVHLSCIILPYSHPVHFDTEDGGNLLLPSGFIAQEYRASQRRVQEPRTCCLCPFVLKMGVTYPCETLVFYIQVHTMSQIIQPQCENIVLLFWFTFLVYCTYEMAQGSL